MATRTLAEGGRIGRVQRVVQKLSINDYSQVTVNPLTGTHRALDSTDYGLSKSKRSVSGEHASALAG